MGSLASYTDLKRIGAGGMGVVVSARDTTLRRGVAIKFLTPGPFLDEQLGARLLREARSAAAINHPSICVVYETGTVGPEEAPRLGLPEVRPGTPFLVMELVEGRSLDAVLADQAGAASGRLPLLEALAIAQAVAEGLAAAHARGIAHRDLKPQNVMLAADGRVKILDFGLARPGAAEPDDPPGDATEAISRAVGRDGSVLGTLAYLAPERLLGESGDARSDLFSFGAMLYEMLSGRRPFRGETTTVIVSRILEANPDPLSSCRPDVPADLERLVRRCLRKAPDERFNDTRDLVLALRDLREAASQRAAALAAGGADSGETAWVPPPSGARAARRERRAPRRVRAAAAASGIALLAALGGYLIGKGGTARPPAPDPPAPPAPRVRQLTSEGRARSPALSPDGQFAAYVLGGEGAPDRVLVHDLVGNQALEVYRGRSVELVEWSPNGAMILLRDFEDPTGRLAAYVVSRLGGPARRAGSPELLPRSWSPDGTRLVGISPGRVLGIVELASGETKYPEMPELPGGLADVKWSPDGSRLLLVVLAESGFQAWTAGVDGSRAVRLMCPTFVSACWAPGGHAIYYLADSGGARGLWRLAIHRETGEAAELPRLLYPEANSEEFAIARDGRTAAILPGSRIWRLALLELDAAREGAASAATFLTTGTASDRHPRWSPDGRSIAFVRNVGQEKSQLFILDLRDGAARQITRLESACVFPAWSPDGGMLAFVTQDEDRLRLWRVGRDGTGARAFPQCAPTGMVAWGPGAEILYQCCDDRGYRFLDPRSGAERSLGAESSQGRMWQIRPSPDATRVAVTRNVTDGAGISLWTLSATDGSGRLLLDERAAPVGWSGDGVWLYIVRDEPASASVGVARSQIARVSTESGEVEILCGLPLEATNWSSLDITPDGRRLVASARVSQTDVWLVENFDPDSAVR